MPLSAEVRRVVTSVDKNGKAVVLFDSDAPNKKVREGRGTVSRLLWTTTQTPCDVSGDIDRGNADVKVAPPKNGSIFRVIDIPPTPKEIMNLPNDWLHKQHEGSIPKRHLPPTHPLMHATRSIDYAIIMSGEIDMLLDDSEVHFKAGDMLVQQATNHAWVNRGAEPCRIAFILIDSQEP